MSSPLEIDPATAILTLNHSSEVPSFSTLSSLSNVPRSTIGHRARGRISNSQKGINQQYLTPAEESVLVSYFLRMSNNGYPLPVKFAGSLAHVIALHRNSLFHFPIQERDGNESIKPPGKNWSTTFHKRHPELKSTTLKALEWDRHEHSIYEKVVEWYTVIGKELKNPALKPRNVYNMDETGVLLAVLNSLKVLVSSDDLRKCRGTGKDCTRITAIECISADFKVLLPLVIWPASTHRANWMTYPTPGWHYGIQENGYTDSVINLKWLTEVFNPQTKAIANSDTRLLISDGFGTHESAEIQRFCFENNIVLARLPSHSSHKLQPCDVGPFGPLKTYYRKEVERLYRRGSQHIGKPHFTRLYCFTQHYDGSIT